MTDTDPTGGGPEHGRIPSPLDPRQLALARALEEQSSPPQSDPVSPRARISASQRRSAAANRARPSQSHSYSQADMQHIQRVLAEAQREAAELREAMNTAGDQLVSERARNEALEQKLRASDARWIAHDVARQKAESDAALAGEESRRYKFQLEVALRDIQRAQEEVVAVEEERNQAEEAAARARDRERKLIESLKLRDARDQGRAEGRAEGMREGWVRGREETRVQERRRAVKALEGVLQREFPDGIPEGVLPESPPRGQSPERRERVAQYPTFASRMEQDQGGARSPATMEPGPSTYRASRRTPAPPPPLPVFPPPTATRSRRGSEARATSVMQMPAQPDIPDVAPMFAPPPLGTITTPQRMPEVLHVSPSPSRAPSRMSRAPSHHSHMAIDQLPDGYVPILGEDQRIVLPPPHEVQPTRGVLDIDPEPLTRSVSRHQSRASFRGEEPTIYQPQPSRVLDPAYLYEEQPGVPPRPAPEPIQRPRSSGEIRHIRSEGRSLRTAQSPGPGPRQDYGLGLGLREEEVQARNDGGYAGSVGWGGTAGGGGRLSRIEERESEPSQKGAPSPSLGSVRYAAAQQLPQSRVASMYGGGEGGRAGSVYGGGEGYGPGGGGGPSEGTGGSGSMSRQQREALRRELRSNGGPDGMVNAVPQTPSSRASRPFSHVRRPANITMPAPLAPGGGGGGGYDQPQMRREADNRSRASHARSVSMQTPGRSERGMPDERSMGHRRTMSGSTAPAIVVSPPSRTPSRRDLTPDIPYSTAQPYLYESRAPSPAMSERTVKPLPHRPQSSYSVNPAQVRLPPSAAPSQRPLPGGWDQDDEDDRRSVRNGRMSTAPAPLPLNNRQSQQFQGPPMGGPAYGYPQSDGRTNAGSPETNYGTAIARDLYGMGGRGPNRPPSRAPTVAGSPREDRRRSYAPTANGRTPLWQGPPLPLEGESVGGSPGESFAPPRPISRAQSVRPVSFVEPARPLSRAQSMRPPGTNRTQYPALPEDGATDYDAIESDRGTLPPRPPSRAYGPPISRNAPYEVAASDLEDSPMPDLNLRPQPSQNLRTQQSQRSMRSARSGHGRGPSLVDNELDMAYLATGRQEAAFPPPLPVPSRPVSRAMSVKSILKPTPRTVAPTVETESDEDDAGGRIFR